MQDRSEKNIVTPGHLLPAGEPLGDMLLEMKRPAEALAECEASQARETGRYGRCRHDPDRDRQRAGVPGPQIETSIPSEGSGSGLAPFDFHP